MRWLRRHLFVAISATIAGLIIVIAVLLVRRALVISPEDKNAIPALAAGITLTGVLVTAAVTLVGLLFRRSIDLRTDKLAVVAERRAQVEQHRLTMQTVMETVKLLTAPDGKPAPAVQASTALIALAKLGELSLALDLAAELWPNGQLTARAGSGLCDDGIASEDPRLCRMAALLLMNNWMRLESATGQLEWPSSLQSWPPWLADEPKALITTGLQNWLAATPARSTQDFRQILLDSTIIPITTGRP